MHTGSTNLSVDNNTWHIGTCRTFAKLSMRVNKVKRL